MKEEVFWILLAKKVNREATSLEIEQLQELIREDYELGAIAERMQQIWDTAPAKNLKSNNHQAEDAYLTLANKIAAINNQSEQIEDTVHSSVFQKGFFGKGLFYWGVAASIVIVVSLFLLSQPQPQPAVSRSQTAQNEIRINPGSKTRVELPDGSLVWVNSATQLNYSNDFNGKTREIQLDGEAFFEVKKNPNKPFIVHTSGIDIKVLGTAFNVKAYKSDATIEATLIHGSIEVINNNRPNDTHLMLKPHEKLVYLKNSASGNSSNTVQEKDFSINIKPLKKNILDSEVVETAWIYNKLAFEDESLSDVVLKMERWYNVRIMINSEDLEKIRISGSFVNESLEEAIRELQFLIPFKYIINKNEVIITKK